MMIKKIEDLNYYELLEVSPSATSQEIHRAYERIRRVYEPNSIALYSLFTPEETAVINQRIEDAYRTLVYDDNRKRYDAQLRGQYELPELPAAPKYHQPRYVQPTLTLPSENRSITAPEAPARQPAPEKPAHETATPVSHFIAEFTGPAIKMLREQKGFTLRHIADITKLGTRYLECIEEETFQKLPARAYVRGFLMLYAKALGCDPERMASDYLKRYEAGMNPSKQK
jgi:flagellar biosynthesis protein FlhG